MNKEQRVAKEILEHIGGKENIKSIEHCATRLRIILNDKEKIDEKAVENIDGVKGQFFAAAQYQIILGTGFVNKVYAEIVGGSENLAASSAKEDAYANMSLLQKISRTFGDVFVPIIPVLVATGLFMGLRGLLTNLGLLQTGTNFYLFSEVLTDTAFAFLPALVAWSTMKKFGGTPVIGIVIGLMLVSPSLPNAYNVAAGTETPIYLSILGLSIPVVGYQGSVLPALVLGIIASKTQKFLKKFIPDVIDLIVTPFLTLLISMILGLLIVGPIMHTAELWVFGAIKNFMLLPYGIGGAVVGGIHQVIVVTGIHHAFSALEVELISTTGVNPFNAMITCGIVAQGAAAVAVALKTKDKKKRSLYISSAVPAFLGITEPVPALVLGIIASKTQKFLKKFIPDVIDLIVTPFLTLLISMILGLLIVGPIMHTAELWVFGAIKNFMLLPYGIGGAVVGGIHQVIVVTGIHHAFSALEVELISTTGVNPFNAMITCGIVAQGAAAVAVALKTKDKKKRSLYISSAVPAFLGITEPAIFGINLRFIKPFVFGCIGGAAGGAIAGMLNMAGTGMGITALPGILLYMNNVVGYLIINGVSIAVAFCLTFFLFKTEE